jgi:hypothetical protein
MIRRLTILVLFCVPLAGCQTEHKVETNSVIEIKPIEIKPIYATIDVNVKVQVDRELDSFFDYEKTLQPPPKPNPAAPPDVKKDGAK